MKKTIMALLMTLGFLAFGGNAAVASDTGVITLSGSIGIVNEIVITQTPEATNLDILGGEEGLLIATVEESSNSPTGYTIFMNSVNDSNLVNTENGEESVTYTVSYDGAAPISLTTADMPVKTVGELAGLVTDESQVVINVIADGTNASGTYTDLITVSIAAN